jgi:hypothetical protein
LVIAALRKDFRFSASFSTSSMVWLTRRDELFPRLEHAGTIKMTRRLKRIWIERMSPITR